MTSPSDQQAPGPTGLVVPMRRVVRVGAWAFAGALPLSVLLGFLVAGPAGAWGALIGMGLAAGFFAMTLAVALGSASLQVSALGAAVLGSWVMKMLLLIVVLAMLRRADFYSRPVLFVSLLVGTVGALVLEAVVVTRTRVPYTEVDAR